jgi:hypothetical protein
MGLLEGNSPLTIKISFLLPTDDSQGPKWKKLNMDEI